MKSNRKILILLTSEDPLDGGEIFIRHEIDTCSHMYDYIYVFSELRKTTTPYKYCSNCEIIGLKFLRSRFRFVHYMFYGLISILKLRDVEKTNGLKRHAFRCYERGKIVSMFNKIKHFFGSSSILKSNDDVVFYSYWFLNTATAAVLLREYYSKKSLNTKCISRAHGYDLYSERNSLSYLPFQLFNVNNLDIIFPCSDAGRLYLCDKYPSFSTKFITARLGTIDRGVENYIDTDSKHFVTCSSLIPLKRVELFAEAFKLLSLEENVFWTCIGDGSQKELIVRILKGDKFELPSNVSLMGRMNNSEIMDFYFHNSIDYFVNVSEYEGVPVTIMEALSFGIPVIATDVGGTGELVNSDNGCLIDPNTTPEYLKDILKESIKLNCNKKRIAARKTWEEKCNAKTNYCNFHKMICELF